MNNIGKFSVTNMMSSIVKYGSHILFAIGLLIMAYLSFVDDLGLDPSIRNITTTALIAMVLNYFIWDGYYRNYCNEVMSKDIKNENYCIHRRYYQARKTWDYSSLQKRIRKFNQDFIDTWLQDVEDVIGRTRENIEKEGYRFKVGKKKYKYPHTFLIWRVKHHKYPKSGIKTARDLLNVLRVGKSGSMTLHVHAAERYQNTNRIQKIIISMLTTGLAASLVYDFIQGDMSSALLRLVMNVAILFTSFFFGALAGTKGGQIKLSIAEEVSELLEEWKNEPASEEPFVPSKTFIVEKEVERQIEIV